MSVRKVVVPNSTMVEHSLHGIREQEELLTRRRRAQGDTTHRQRHCGHLAGGLELL